MMVSVLYASASRLAQTKSHECVANTTLLARVLLQEAAASGSLIDGIRSSVI